MKHLMRSTGVVVVLAAVLLTTGCNAYRALLFRDGPYDLANEELLQGELVASHPDDVRFTYPARIESGGNGVVRWDVNAGSNIWWAGIDDESVTYEVWVAPATAAVSSFDGESFVSWGVLDPAAGHQTISTDQNTLAVADIAAIYPDAVERLNRTFSQDASEGDEGLILAIRTRVNGIWSWNDPGQSDVAWSSEPFLQELHWEAWGNQ